MTNFDTISILDDDGNTVTWEDVKVFIEPLYTLEEFQLFDGARILQELKDFVTIC